MFVLLAEALLLFKKRMTIFKCPKCGKQVEVIDGEKIGNLVELYCKRCGNRMEAQKDG